MNRKMQKPLVVLALIATLFASMARPAYAVFDKIRFATDLGVAFFAFHHWVYKPYKEGAFAAGAPHRTKAMLKGGAALLFTLNRLKAANNIVHTTNDPLLKKIGASLDRVTSSFSSVGTDLKAGKFKPEDLSGMDGNINNVISGAGNAGIKVKDVPVEIPNS